MEFEGGGGALEKRRDGAFGLRERTVRFEVSCRCLANVRDGRNMVDGEKSWVRASIEVEFMEVRDELREKLRE